MSGRLRKEVSSEPKERQQSGNHRAEGQARLGRQVRDGGERRRKNWPLELQAQGREAGEMWRSTEVQVRAATPEFMLRR